MNAPEFQKIICDFITDISTVFPEYTDECNRINCMKIDDVFNHCRKVYAPHFFNVLYRNDSVLFAEPIELLPGLNFKPLWEMPDISDATKNAIWKYLQLVMFSVVSNLSDTSIFGDAAKLFEAIDETVLKSKLEEVMEQMQTVFKEDEPSHKQEQDTNSESAEYPSSDGTFDPNAMHDHLNSLLGGKIGSLAKEIAEETAAELNVDITDESSVRSVFQNLFKNPGKLMAIVKNVGHKLDSKLKSGEIKESEIMQEASELMQKMKKMPGVNNMSNFFKKMSSMGGMEDAMDFAKMASSMGLSGKQKMNMGAMQSQLNKNIKSAQMKERLQQKLQQRRTEQSQSQSQPQPQPPLSNSGSENVKKSQPASTPDAATNQTPLIPKKKSKNKK